MTENEEVMDDGDRYEPCHADRVCGENGSDEEAVVEGENGEEAQAKARSPSEDRVEDWSDAEGEAGEAKAARAGAEAKGGHATSPVQPQHEPHTPQGAAGRFAKLHGAGRSTSGAKAVPRDPIFEVEGEEMRDHVEVGADGVPAPGAPRGWSSRELDGFDALASTQEGASQVNANKAFSLTQGLNDLLNAVDETIPASAGALLGANASSAIDDGDTVPAMLGSAELNEETVPANIGDPRDDSEDHVTAEDCKTVPNAAGGAADPADVSDSDDEPLGDLGDGLAKLGGPLLDLPDEPWMQHSAAERERWERVRPRAVRREALHLKSLKLPMAAMTRLLRLHPSLQNRSTEAVDIVSYSTVLLLQAAVRAAARGKNPGQRIQFDDIRQVCMSTQELQFLNPVQYTLDASAFVMRNHAAQEEVPAQQESAARNKMQSMFARNAGPALAADKDEESEHDTTPIERKKQQGLKRSAPASVQKSAKAPKRAATAKGVVRAPAPPGGGIASFFGGGGAAAPAPSVATGGA